MLSRKRPSWGSTGGSGEKYTWTMHSRFKMKYYGIADSRVKRIIRFPTRYEEGIVPNTVAVMQPAGTKKYSEIWAMYKLVSGDQQASSKSKLQMTKRQRLKIITVWRYPGVSPKRDPIPKEVLEEIKSLL